MVVHRPQLHRHQERLRQRPRAAAYHLYNIFGTSTGFHTQGQNMFNWEKSHLFVSSTGQVYDHENANGTFVTTALTYNQGTFLGAAHAFGDDTSAGAAASYTMNSLCQSDGLLPQYTPSTDSAGFNGICVRWLIWYMDATGTGGTYSTWLYNNANTAWGERNANGLDWCDWGSTTPASGNYSWSCPTPSSSCKTWPRNDAG